MSRLVTNTAWLMLAQIGGLFIPLIELPILARALQQQGYGQVLYALGIAVTASIFVEFGFNFSGARSVVKLKHNPKALAQLVTNVLIAKLLLSIGVISIVAVLILSGTGETAVSHLWLIWISLFILAFGFSPLWYYAGREQLVLLAFWDLGIRIIGLVFIIFMIATPQHAQRVLIIQATVGFINTLIPSLLMLRRTGWGRICFSGSWQVLRESWALFLYRGAQSILGSLASILLGLFGGARAVGAFVPAEKLVRAASGLIGPLLSAAFPHMVQLYSEPAHAARKLVTKVLFIISAATLFFAMLTVWLAPWIVNLVFGPGYVEAIKLLKILVWVVPLRIGSMILACLWFIPIGKEQIASRIMMLNLLMISGMAILLVPSWGGLGMTLSFVSAELVMFLMLGFLFCRKAA